MNTGYPPIDRYRTVLAANPNDAVALNNLAYGLAVRKGQPAEAIGYAERALTLTRGSATVADTLAWVQHLLGRDREAAQLLAAVKALPANAEVRLHAAVVYAAIGMWSLPRRSWPKRCASIRRWQRAKA